MTQKRARANFYGALRRIAPNYRWELVAGGIRGRKKFVKKGESEFDMYCPLTAVASKEKKIRLSDFDVAAANLGMNQRSATLIADTADNSGKNYNKQIRQTLLKCVGLRSDL